MLFFMMVFFVGEECFLVLFSLKMCFFLLYHVGEFEFCNLILKFLGFLGLVS